MCNVDCIDKTVLDDLIESHKLKQEASAKQEKHDEAKKELESRGGW